MEVWDYFQDKRREIEEFGLMADDVEFVELEGSSGRRGRIWGRIGFSDRTFLSVSERVEVVGSGIHRTEYAYFLVMDGGEFWGHERDPSHEGIEVHEHDRDHKRTVGEPIAFKDALLKAWDTVALEEAVEPPDRGDL